jgi:hypothetical protein
LRELQAFGVDAIGRIGQAEEVERVGKYGTHFFFLGVPYR